MAYRNAEDKRAAHKRYYAGNRDAILARNAKWLENNKDRYKTWKRDYNSNDIDRRKRNLVAQAKKRAKEKGLDFDITVDDLVWPEYCPILRVRLVYEGRGSKSFLPDSPSIDRVVPSVGYVKGNVQVICARANVIKSNATIEELRAVADFMEMMWS